MSPEQARGGPRDARSDLYAVGALLHRMLTGKPHLDVAGMDEFSARNRVAAAPAASLVGIPVGLRGVVARSLAPTPEARVQDARAFSQALADAERTPQATG
jgi:serine/threonine-protein kinase